MEMKNVQLYTDFCVVDFKMNKQYTVVEFDDGVQLIPNIWIQGNEAFWPHFKTMSKCYSSVKNKLPPKPVWEKCKILRVLYSTGKTMLKYCVSVQ